jgi:hypothetical protein
MAGVIERLGRGPTPGRRRFLQWLGLTSLWGALGGARLGRAQASAASAPKAAQAAPADTAAASSGVPGATPPPPISEPARTLARLLRERYPKGIGEVDLERVARDLDGDLRAGERLRAAKLGNSDEPDFIFRA